MDIGIDIPKIGLGTYKLYGDDNKQAHEIADEACKLALNLGIRHIDTANLYKTEQNVGNAIKSCGIPRNEIFVTTKISMNHLKSGKIETGINASFKALGVDYIDLMLLHRPVDNMNLKNWLELERLYKGKYKGKIRYIGVSNFSIDHLLEIINNGTIVPFANQIEISPFFTREKIVNFCMSHNIKIISHSTLSRGKTLSNEKLVQYANSINCTPAQILLSWCLHKGYHVIPGTHDTSQLADNINSEFVKLDDIMIKNLDNLNQNYTLYPQYVYNEDEI